MPHTNRILRRQCLRILTGSSLAITTGIALPTATGGAFKITVRQPQSGTDWPGFLGPNRDGRSPQSIGPRDWTNGQLPLRWQRDLGDGYAMGSLKDGRFYQPHLSGRNTVLDCLDASTGQPIWRQQRESDYRDLYGYDSGPRCSPTLNDDQVFQYGVDGVLTAYESETGARQWQRNLNQDYGVVQNFFGVGSSPVLHRDLLIVMVGGSPEQNQSLPPGALNRVQPNGTALVALDQKTGEERYRLGDELASYSSPIVVTMDEKPLGLAFCRGGLLGFDPDQGTEHFFVEHRSSKLESVNAATPIVHGRQVLISETYGVGSKLLEIDPTTWKPSVVWADDPEQRDQSLQAHWNTPVLYDGYLYASSGRHSGPAEIRCVRWKDGQVMWKEEGWGRCSQTLAGDQLVILSERGDLLLVEPSPDGFRLITQHGFGDATPDLKYPAWAAPIIADNRLFVRDAHRLFCFDVS